VIPSSHYWYSFQVSSRNILGFCDFDCELSLKWNQVKGI
jgi:hypothetical protein